MREKARLETAGFALTLAVTVAGFAAWTWPLARQLSTHTIVSAPETRGVRTNDGGADWDLIIRNDQNLSVWNTAENARAIVRPDWFSLLSQGQCYPMPSASALGEHMIESGVLAAPWWLATRDPVFSYNLSLLTALVAGALGMYLFVLRLAGSVPGAIASAVAFSFSTPRLVDLPVHPAVVGTHWIPWVLWAFEGIVATLSPVATFAFAATLLMASLVGSYPLMAVGVFGASYGAVRLVQKIRDHAVGVPAFILLAAASVPAFAATGAILSTYARVQREWALSANPDAKFLVGVSDYLPGGLLPVGSVALIGLVPLVLLRREAARRIVPALTVATVATFLLTTRFGGAGGWSAYEALSGIFPLLGSVRAPGKVGLAVVFGVQALGAIGWSRLMLTLDPRVASLLAAVLIAITLAETSAPPVVQSVLGPGAAVELREIAPPRDRIAALGAALGDDRDRRAVLDLPVGRMVKAPAALIDAAYHGHPTSACYNSFVPPTMRATYALAETATRTRTPESMRALAAAGFGFIVERTPSAAAARAAMSYPEPARLLAIEREFVVWALPHAAVLRRDAEALEISIGGGATRGDTFAPDPPHEIDLVVKNLAAEVWAAPHPLVPLFAGVELVPTGGGAAFRSRARGVLPLAIAPGETTTIQLVMATAPEPGSYRAEIRLDGHDEPLVAPQFVWPAATR